VKDMVRECKERGWKKRDWSANGEYPAHMYKRIDAMTSLREEGSHSARSSSGQAFGNGWD